MAQPDALQTPRSFHQGRSDFSPIIRTDDQLIKFRLKSERQTGQARAIDISREQTFKMVGALCSRW
jgi:hypothetical protein